MAKSRATMKRVVTEINKVINSAVGADLIPKRKRLRVLLRSAKALCATQGNGEGLYLVRPDASARRRRRHARKK
jgi:hypothetical protein